MAMQSEPGLYYLCNINAQQNDLLSYFRWQTEEAGFGVISMVRPKKVDIQR